MHEMRSLHCLRLIFLILFFHGPAAHTSSYSCTESKFSVGFTLSTSFHSAWNPLSNCSLSQCVGPSNSCRSSNTSCFDYRTADNTSYCAPASLCSLLEPCSNATGECSSNTTVCVVNSCCSANKVCLPLAWTDLCSPSPTMSSMISTATTQTTTEVPLTTQALSACLWSSWVNGLCTVTCGAGVYIRQRLCVDQSGITCNSCTPNANLNSTRNCYYAACSTS